MGRPPGLLTKLLFSPGKTILPIDGSRHCVGRRAKVQKLPPDDPFDGWSTPQSSAPYFLRPGALRDLIKWRASSRLQAHSLIVLFPSELTSEGARPGRPFLRTSELGKLLCALARSRWGEELLRCVFACIYEWQSVRIEGKKEGGWRERRRGEEGKEGRKEGHKHRYR